MNNNENEKSIKNKVLEAIKKGEVKMRPRWHFILRASLAVLGAVLIFLALIYLVSFIIFILRRNGIFLAPAFGFRGFGIFLFSLPWLLILFSIIFLGILELLVKKYSFAYRQPLLYTVIGIIALVTILGFFIERIPFHSGLLRLAEEDRLPIAGSFYRGFGMGNLDNIHVGRVISLNGDNLIIENRNGESLSILIGSETKFPLGVDFSENNLVVVFGDRERDTVRALGISKMSQEEMMRFMPSKHIRFMPALR